MHFFYSFQTGRSKRNLCNYSHGEKDQMKRQTNLSLFCAFFHCSNVQSFKIFPLVSHWIFFLLLNEIIALFWSFHACRCMSLSSARRSNRCCDYELRCLQDSQDARTLVHHYYRPTRKWVREKCYNAIMLCCFSFRRRHWSVEIKRPHLALTPAAIRPISLVIWMIKLYGSFSGQI